MSDGAGVMLWSERQRALMLTRLPRITIVQGCISSGKTFACNHRAVRHIVSSYGRRGLILFAGKTLRTLERNVLTPLSLAYPGMFSYSIAQKRAELCGIRIELEGCNDIRAENRIRGATCEFIYGDELTLWNREFMARCMGSLRVPGACFLGTTNPDTPMNFVKTDYLDRAEELGLLALRFTMEDNPSLSAEYVRKVGLEYTGALHDRFIKGLWVKADGLVYPQFDEGAHVCDTDGMSFERYYISCDYGTYNPFSSGLWGLCGGVWYRIREFYHDGAGERRQLTDEEYHEALICLAGGLAVEGVIVDPSAASFIACMRRHGRFRVRPADNAVLDGIRHTASALTAGQIRIGRNCGAAIREFSLYAWDEGAGEDRPIKQFDHAMDDIRYFVHTVLRDRGAMLRVAI